LVDFLNKPVADRRRIWARPRERSRRIEVGSWRTQERARNLLLGILGRDMRSPLNAIQLTAHHLKNLNAGEAVSSAAGMLIRSGTRMKVLLDDLTDFNRQRLGIGLRIIPSEGDLRAILEDELQELRSAHFNQHVGCPTVEAGERFGRRSLASPAPPRARRA